MREPNLDPEVVQKAMEDMLVALAVTKGSIHSALKHWESLDDEKRREMATRALHSADDLAEALRDLDGRLKQLTEVNAQSMAREVSSLEEALKGLRGVRGAKVHVDRPNGGTIEVLVVPERDIEETMQDVRQVAGSILGVDIPESRVRITSTRDAQKAVPVAARRRLSTVATKTSDGKFSAKVWLELLGDTLSGETSSTGGEDAQRRSIALATVKAVQELVDETIRLDDVGVVEMGDLRYAVATLKADQDALIGAALVRTGEYDAVARAVLDGLNRLMSKPWSANGEGNGS